MANNTINDVTSLASSNQNILNGLMSQINNVNIAIQQLGSQIINSTREISNSFSEITNSASIASQAVSAMSNTMNGYTSSVANSQPSVLSFMTNTMNTVVLIKNFHGAVKLISGYILAKAAAMGTATVVGRLYQTCLAGLTVQLGSATAAAAAFSASLTMGLSLAITAVAAGIGYLMTQENEAEKSTESLTQEENKYTDALTKAKAEMILVISELENFNGNKKEEAAKVQELNQKYGESFGYYDTLGQWYNALIEKSEDYCDAMILEAKIRDAVNKAAESEIKYEELKEKYGSDEPKPSPLKPIKIEKEKNTTFEWGRSINENATVGEIRLAVAKQLAFRDKAKVDDYLKEYNAKMQGLKIGSKPNRQTSGSRNNNLNNTDSEFDFNLSKLNSVTNVQKALTDLTGKQNKATIEFAPEFNDCIGILEAELERIKLYISHGTKFDLPLEIEGKMDTDSYVTGLGEEIKKIEKEQAKNIQDIGNNLTIEPQPLVDCGNAAQDASMKQDALIASLGGVGSIMGSLGSIMGEGAAEWLNWGANVVGAIAAAIPLLIELTGAQTGAAATGAASAVASIPIVGPILAVAAIASVLAAIATIPKFANGGIAYGPTLGLFGEYSGASSNPEVVAPLDKLRTLIQPAGGGTGGRVEFKIQGRELVGILSKMNHINNRVHG